MKIIIGVSIIFTVLTITYLYFFNKNNFDVIIKPINIR